MGPLIERSPGATDVQWVREQMSAGRRGLGVSVVLGSLATLCGVGLLGASGWLISTAAQHPPVLTLTVAAVLVRALAVGRGVLRYSERLTGHDAALRGLVSLRVSVYRQLERLAPGGLMMFRRGDLLSRLVFDVDAALDLPLRVVLPWAQAVVVAAATTAFLWWLTPNAGMVVGVCALVAIALLPVLASRLAARATLRIAPHQGALTQIIVGSLHGAADIAAFGALERVSAAIRSADAALTRAAKSSARALGLTSGLIVALQGLAVCGVLAVAIPAVTDGTLSPVWLAVAVFLPLALFDALASLPAAALSLRRLRGSARRLAELAELAALGPDDSVPSGWSASRGVVEIEHLSAGWPGLPVLDDVSFRVDSGERLWVVGPSGVGKSTLAQVLVGFLDYAGSATIDGKQIRDICGDDLRSSVALLAQRGHLFDTSIRENVLLGRKREDAVVRDALDRVGLGPWIETLAAGMSTEVGPAGLAVSGGQARRIELARLLIEPRRVVILDEPTEHLDVDAADALDRVLEQVLASSTRIVITHRLTRIADADLVLLIDRRPHTGPSEVSASTFLIGTARNVAEHSAWFAVERARQVENERVLAWTRSLPVGVAVYPRRDLSS